MVKTMILWNADDKEGHIYCTDITVKTRAEALYDLDDNQFAMRSSQITNIFDSGPAQTESCESHDYLHLFSKYTLQQTRTMEIGPSSIAERKAFGKEPELQEVLELKEKIKNNETDYLILSKGRVYIREGNLNFDVAANLEGMVDKT